MTVLISLDETNVCRKAGRITTGLVEDGEKYGGGVRAVVDFGAGEKLGENRECGGEVEGSSGWAEAVLKGSA